jgi:zinc transporter 1/2/3
MPEITDIFESYQTESNKNVGYPVMEATVVFGFILTFLLEKAIEARCRRKKTVMQSACDKDQEEASGVGDTVDHPVSERTEVSKQTTDSLNRPTVHPTTAQFISEERVSEIQMLALNPGIKEYALVIALSLHALIEGLVAGFLEDPEKVFTLLLGLALHKIPEGMIVTIQLFRGRVKWKITAAIGIFFATLSPVGMAIATAIDESGTTNSASGQLAEAILQALGAGTLLYVVVMDILLTEFSTEDQSFRKCICFLAGFLFIAAISFIPHDQSDDLDECNRTTVHE